MKLFARRFFGPAAVPVLMLAAGSAGAAEPGTTGWYVDTTYGETRISRDTADYSMFGDKAGFSFGVGYAVNRYLAFQGSYHDFGDNYLATNCPRDQFCITSVADEADLDGLSVAAIGTWPVHRMIDVYGKLGLLRWDADFNQLPLDDSATDLLYGVGVGVNLSPRWRVNLAYEQADVDLESTRFGVRFAF